MMSRLFRIAIVGLGRSDVMVLRDAFQTVSGAYQFEWVSADHAQIDLLVVNSFFINSSGIQKIIQQQAMPCLKVDHQSEVPCVGDDQLHLPLQETDSFKAWLYARLFGQVSPETDSHVPSSMPAPTVAAARQAEDRPVQNKPRPAPVTPQRESLTKKMPQAASAERGLNELMTHLVETESGLWQISDRHHQLAVADCRNKVLWASPSVRVSTDALSLPLSLQPVQQIPEQYVPTDLRQWLWQLAWVHTHEQMFVSKNMPVKLLAWPQPAVDVAQQTVLAACSALRRTVSNAEQLSQKINIPLQDAQRLMTTLLAVKFAVETNMPAAAVDTVVTAAAQDVEAEQESSFFSGFLSKLRNKLGF